MAKLLGVIFLVFSGLAGASSSPSAPPSFPLQRVCQTGELFKGRNFSPRRCERIKGDYAKRLIQLYSRLPETLRRETWAIDRFIIYPRGAGPAAYTEVQYTRQGPKLIIGIKEGVFVSDLTEYLKNLDLKYLGVDIKETLQFTPSIPVAIKVETLFRNLRGEDLTLASTFIHELGHAVDLRYGVGDEGRLCFPDFKRFDFWECWASPLGWHAYTWKYSAKFGVNKVGALIDVEETASLRFPSSLRAGSSYATRLHAPQISVAEVREFYSQLRLLPVISSYALAGPAEDFAESWADYWMNRLFSYEALFFLDGRLEFSTREQRSLVKYEAKTRFILDLVQDLERGRRTALTFSNKGK